MSQELINFIKENQAKGLSKKQITRSLLAAGWQQKDVDAAFLQLDVPLSSLPPFQIDPQISGNLKKAKKSQAANSPDGTSKIKFAPLVWKDSTWFLAICLVGSFLAIHTVYLVKSIQTGYPLTLYLKNLPAMYICWNSFSCFFIDIVNLGTLFVPGLLLFAILSNKFQFATVGITIIIVKTFEYHFLYSGLSSFTRKIVIITDLFDLSIILIPGLVLLCLRFFFRNASIRQLILKGFLFFLLLVFSFKLIFPLTFFKFYHLPKSINQKLIQDEIQNIKKDYKKNTKPVNW